MLNGRNGKFATLTDGSAVGPYSVAVDPMRDFIYVASANYVLDTLSIIDGRTNGLTTIHLTGAKWPFAVAVNPVTNRVYVANYLSKTVSVVAGAMR